MLKNETAMQKHQLNFMSFFCFLMFFATPSKNIAAAESRNVAIYVPNFQCQPTERLDISFYDLQSCLLLSFAAFFYFFG
jgi:hypothetical protein